MKRIFLIVLDSVGIGELEDAKDYGDQGTNTLKSVSSSPFLKIPNLKKLGLAHMDGVDYLEQTEVPIGMYGRMKEVSSGKDTTIGHWEIAGIHSKQPLPTYPDGFPPEVLQAFSTATKRGVLCNKPYSGTEVIQNYGKAHVESGDLIVYTSADSVFQVAAHEEIVPLETLYEYCKAARELLQGEHGVGRVIARPFRGTEGKFERSENRHDYSLLPPATTMLTQIKEHGLSVIAVGKINDIFAGEGITEFTYTKSNQEGIEKTLEFMDKDFQGLCFVNLVDYDMLYGHRNDVDGYAKALTYFDERLPELMAKLGEDDVLMITADHGCDPGNTASTDHSREHTPLLIYGKKIVARNLGTRETFSDIGATVLDLLEIPSRIKGKSVLSE